MNVTSQPAPSRGARRAMSIRLLSWGLASWAAGLVILLSLGALAVRSFAQAFAAQCVAWGLILAGLALFALRQSQRPSREADSTERDQRDAQQMRRLLEFNRKLNFAWLAIAVLLLIAAAVRRDARLAGHGAGVLVQVAFLLHLDRAFLPAFSESSSRQSY